MSYLNLRIKLKIKREFLKFIGYRPNNFVNINRSEKIPLNSAEKIENYSQIITQIIYDPRSERDIGHIFNSRDVFKLTDVIVEPKQGIIYSQEGKIVSESTNWSTSNLYESFPWNPKRVTCKVDAKEVINLTSNAFGHWLVEDLGSILYLIDKFPKSPLLVFRNSSKFVLDLLQILDREVIYCDGPTRIKSMLMVTKQQDSGWMHPKDLDMLNKFKEKVLKSNSKSEERIYATRNFLTRSPKNESAIENIFKDRGFTILRMEDLNFIDEINLLHSTNILAGVSGSWQFNSIWMKSNSQIIDIVNENYWTELIHRVCEMKALDYKWFIYNGAFSSEVNELALGLFLNRVVR